VGRDVDTDEGIRQSIVSNGIQDITLAIGQQDDMASVMSALDVLVVSSRSEGFPNVLGEAMSCEVPCATTDVGDARRIVGHEQFVVRPGEPDELARVVISLCKMDACKRRSLGRALRDRVERNFGIERTWDAYRRVYSESG
jgi:glycosyltransferase involved in cell wall biosynthesis